jgi:hypothetical protein
MISRRGLRLPEPRSFWCVSCGDAVVVGEDTPTVCAVCLEDLRAHHRRVIRLYPPSVFAYSRNLSFRAIAPHARSFWPWRCASDSYDDRIVSTTQPCAGNCEEARTVGSGTTSCEERRSAGAAP